jgi:hypothetical protein
VSPFGFCGRSFAPFHDLQTIWTNKQSGQNYQQICFSLDQMIKYLTASLPKKPVFLGGWKDFK